MHAPTVSIFPHYYEHRQTWGLVGELTTSLAPGSGAFEQKNTFLNESDFILEKLRPLTFKSLCSWICSQITFMLSRGIILGEGGDLPSEIPSGRGD